MYMYRMYLCVFLLIDNELWTIITDYCHPFPGLSASYFLLFLHSVFTLEGSVVLLFLIFTFL